MVVFYTGVTRHFQMVCTQQVNGHNLETKHEVKVLQEMNTKHGIIPDVGVDKLKKKHTQALKDHVDDLMARFRAESHHWTAHSNHESVIAPTDSNIELRPNVPVCVFIPDQLDEVLLPDHSMIDNNS